MTLAFHDRRSPLARHLLSLYEDPFLGGAVADLVDLATGAREAGPVSLTPARVVERLERRGFDLGPEDLVDAGEVTLAGRLGSWLAAPLAAPGPVERPRGSSIRIRVTGEMTTTSWSRPPTEADWVRAAAPRRLLVLQGTAPLLPLCGLAGRLWHVRPAGALSAPFAAAASSGALATGCARLRAWVTVEGHPSGPLAAELAIVWLQGGAISDQRSARTQRTDC